MDKKTPDRSGALGHAAALFIAYMRTGGRG
jgi:hypothetical protein